MAPFCYLITAKGWPNLWWNSAPLEEGRNDAEIGKPLAAIRVQNGASLDDEGIAHDFPKFQGNRGQSMWIQNGPFFVPNLG